MDFTTNEDCVRYIETRVLFHLRSVFKDVQDDLNITHKPDSYLVMINFRKEVGFEGNIYKGISIIIAPEYQSPENPNKFPNVSGELINGDEGNNRRLRLTSLEDILSQIFKVCRDFYAA